MAGGAPRTFIDALLRDGDALFTVPFLYFEEAATPKVSFPWFFRELSDALRARLGETAADWYEKKGKPQVATLDFFVEDADVMQILGGDSGEDGFAAIAGLTSQQNLLSVFDRYAHAATRSHGRRVLDLRAGLGTGTQLLRSTAQRVDGVAVSDLYRRLARRFGRELYEQPPELDYDLVLAFLAPLSRADEWIERARAYHARGARVLLSFAGDQVARMERQGLRAHLMVGLAADVEKRYAETLVWLEEPEKPKATRAVAEPPAYTNPKPLAVLFSLRANSAQYPGGDSHQVQQTAAALRKRGHRVVVSVEPQPRAEGFDIVHLTNITIPAETLEAARAVEASAKAIVLMPIFIDHADDGAWGSIASNWAYAFARDESELARNLELVATRSITINGYRPAPYRNDFMENYERDQRELLRRVDYLIANAYSEVHRIYRYLDSSIPFSIAPSCGDPEIFTEGARAEFVKRYGLQDFIVMAGRFESRKNQLAVAHAFRDLPYHVVMIGRNQNRVYGDVFRQYWPSNVTVIGHLPAREFAGAIAASRVVLIPSWEEVVSLTSLNAALCERPLVLSRNSYEHEYMGSAAHYCDPANPADIVRAVREADAQAQALAPARAVLAQRAREEWNWDRSAALTEAAYYRLLEDNPRGQARRSLARV